ncbi:MAG: hypothetical protein EOP04_27715 [Proteobacteria bacterium]|nr:MAG: hypothetical protein EOP04_27715 [Pseudomonadota bacterium]
MWRSKSASQANARQPCKSDRLTQDRKIAEDVSTAPKEKNVIIDCFAGAGGNAIAFALSGRWNQIFAVEKDEKTLACAKHNAEVYGVSKKIFWIHGDIFEVLQKILKAALKKAVVFGSPPWGGMSMPTLQLVTKITQLTRHRSYIHRLRGL